MISDNRASRCSQISGPGIIAQALPGVENIGFRGGGETRDITEPPQPVIIVRDDGSDLGLLEHELRDEDRVGIGGSAPGKIAGVFAIPADERAPE